MTQRNYIVYFRVGENKFKKTVSATSKLDAENKVKDGIEIDKVVTEPGVPVGDAWKFREEFSSAQAAPLARPADCLDQLSNELSLARRFAGAKQRSAGGFLRSVEDKQDGNKSSSKFRFRLAARLLRVPLQRRHPDPLLHRAA